jgi:hypothetical protein
MQHKLRHRDGQQLGVNDVPLDIFTQNDSRALGYTVPQQQLTDNEPMLQRSLEHHSLAGGLPHLPRQAIRLLTTPYPFQKYLTSYEDAPWLPVCILIPIIALVVGTCAVFFTAFNFMYSLRAEFTLYEIWVGELGLMYLLILGYPNATALSILLGLSLERWLRTNRGRIWRNFCYFIFCGLIYAPYFVIHLVWVPGLEVTEPLRYATPFILSAFFYGIYCLTCLGKNIFKTE